MDEKESLKAKKNPNLWEHEKYPFLFFFFCKISKVNINMTFSHIHKQKKSLLQALCWNYDTHYFFVSDYLRLFIYFICPMAA